VFVVEDGGVLAYEVSVILLPQSRGFEDGVLCLGVSDGGVVSDAYSGVMWVLGLTVQRFLILTESGE